MTINAAHGPASSEAFTEIRSRPIFSAKLVRMNRYSRPWWVTLVLSSVTVATVGYLLLGELTDWPPGLRVVAVLALTVVVDFTTAKWMESVAPTRIDIGPGEKALVSDHSFEIGRVVSGFDDRRSGMVLIRGEVWRARQGDDDYEALDIGSPVRIIERSGLTLVVTYAASGRQPAAERRY